MLIESPQVPRNHWVPTKIQEKEEPVAVSEEEEANSDSEYNKDVESYIRHRQDKANVVVANFLEQVKKNKFGEFKWPPPPKCPTYKFGFIRHYTKEFWFENEMYTGEKYDRAKKFLKQARTSWGYDVDCVPPKRLRPRLFPINMDNESHKRIYGERVSRFAAFAIERINSQALKKIGKTFELVKIEKAVKTTTTTMLLLTLTIKETGSDAEKAIRVAVSSPCGCRGPEILECNLIPSLSSSSSSS